MESAMHLQRPAYVFGVRRPSGALDEFPLRTSALLVEGVRAGAVHEDALGLSFRSSGRAGEIFGTLDLTGGNAAKAFAP